MSRIAGFPTGLLSLVQSQNFGTAPKDLGETVVPVIELADLYLASLQRGVQGGVAAPANGFNTGITVPAGEIWRIYDVSVILSFGAGTTVGAGYPAVVVNNITHILGDGVAVAANQGRQAHMDIAPFWLTAGGIIGVDLREFAGAAFVVNVSALVSQLKA